MGRGSVWGVRGTVCEWAGVQVSDPKDDRKGFLSAFAWRHRKYVISDLPCVRCGAGRCAGGVFPWGASWVQVDVGGALAVIRQPASPHWQAWGLGGSNLGRSFGERRIASSHRDGGQCAGRGVCTGRCEAVAPCDLSRSLAPQHSPPTAWCKARCGVKGGHGVGCDPGARCTWGARWVEGG